jgi:hypothetical protein
MCTLDRGDLVATNVPCTLMILTSMSEAPSGLQTAEHNTIACQNQLSPMIQPISSEPERINAVDHGGTFVCHQRHRGGQRKSRITTYSCISGIVSV